MSRGTMIVGSFSIALFFGLYIIFSSISSPSLVAYWVGLSIGISLGILTCLIIKIPSKAKKDSPAVEMPITNPKWMYFVVLGGMVLAKIVINYFTLEAEIAITNGILSWVVVVISYLGFKVWQQA